MGLQITQVRVKNFRSIESLNVKLTQNNVVLGQNNCGKSNLLRAINIALTPNPTVSEEDIFVAHGETLTKDKESIIDILIRPTNEDGSIASNFSVFWAKVFTTRDFFERYIESNNHQQAGTKNTGEACVTCGRPLSEKVFNDYDGDEGVKRALLDVCQRGRNKAKYALLIAQEIVTTASPENVVPPKVHELFVEVDRLLHLHQEV